jgi:hypothetical protein
LKIEFVWSLSRPVGAGFATSASTHLERRRISVEEVLNIITESWTAEGPDPFDR